MDAHTEFGLDAGKTQPVLCELHQGIAILVLNRPRVRNALSEEAIGCLSRALDKIAGDSSIRAVVLTANGTAFCAGHDLRELTLHHQDPDRGRRYFRKLIASSNAMMQQMTQLPQPVVAAVQGIATAAGCQLVATCDMAVASSAATFATPGLNIGLFCSTPMVPITRRVQRKHAMEMLLTAQAIGARHALRIGLVHRIVRPGSERRVAIAIARKMAGLKQSANAR